MKRIYCVCTLALLMLGPSSLLADEPAAAVPAVAWGKIMPGKAGTGMFTLDITDWPADGKLKLPTPFANITQAYFADDASRKPILVEYNADATSIVLHLPEKKPEGSSGQVRLETAAKSEQFADGRIVLTANDAQLKSVDGTIKLSTERVTQQGQHTIELGQQQVILTGWDYAATRPGRYQVEVTYASLEVPDALLKVTMLGKDATTNAAPTLPTKTFTEFTTINVGWFYVSPDATRSFAIMSRTKQGSSVPMKVKALTLRPACEGQMPVQAEDGTITCHARDVTIHGVKVQYEPKPEKNTVGYWVNEKDWVYWDFAAHKAGKYQVEILQGCGEGHGGSEVVLTIAGQKLPFTVEDTGHFQNFKPRTIGNVELKPGQQRMTVVPVKKAKAAIMDLRQVRLIPIEPEASKK